MDFNALIVKPVETCLKQPLRALAIIACNLLLIAGVKLWGWSGFDLVYFYWFESFIPGLFLVIYFFIFDYIRHSATPFRNTLLSFFLIGFYLFFMVGCGEFLVANLYNQAAEDFHIIRHWGIPTLTGSFTLLWGYLGVLLVETIINGRNAGIPMEALESFQRVFILAISTMVAAAIFQDSGQIVSALYAIVAGKTYYDLYSLAQKQTRLS
jgi:hypothetical protein